MYNEHWASDPLVLSCHGTGRWMYMYTPVKSHSSNKMLFSFCLFTPAKFTSNYMHHYKQLSQTTRASFSSKPRMHGNQSAIHFIQNAETCCNYTIHIMLHTTANQCGGQNFIHTSHKSTTKPDEIIPEQAAKPHASSCFRC